MLRRLAVLIVSSAAIAACSHPAAVSTAAAPVVSNQVPQRAVRRDIPMTRTILRAFAAGTRDSTGRPGRNYWQDFTEYTINARLDVATSTVTGRETVVFHSASDSALRDIVLRLDQNIFAPNAARNDPLPSTIKGTQGMKITRMAVNGAPVTLNASAATPNTNMAFGLDQTVARVRLATPVPAKGTLTLEVEWNFEVPRVESGRGMRMGRLADTLYQVAQWYPRIAMHDDLRGWDAEPYLGNAEFYNQFGHWDVSLDVPAGWLVGATGVLQNGDAVLSAATRERLTHVLESDDQRTIVGASEGGAGKATAAGSRLVWRFVADTAGDFAWATAKRYVWDATRATIPGRGAIPVHILYQPGDTAFKRGGAIVRHALQFYSNLWMPYAFPQLTMADGPELGMEYPMFIMSGLGAADHEAGHEWWPMMVGVNETWYGWMDEGFNQYMNILSNADRAGRAPVLDGVGQQYGGSAGFELEPPMMWDANYAGPIYGFQTYGKAPMMLSALGGVVGDSAVQRAMSQYAHAWRFKHPSPWDYMFFMNNALGRDLGWFWYYWLFTTETVNESIESVTTAGTASTVRVRQAGQMPAPVVLRVQLGAGPGALRPMPNAVMSDSTTAIVTYPADVWFSGNRTFDAVLDFGRPIERITLDPQRRFPDNNPADNSWPR